MTSYYVTVAFYMPCEYESHTYASVTKQYNLVPVTGQRCPPTGKVTVGHASQTLLVYPSIGSQPNQGNNNNNNNNNNTTFV